MVECWAASESGSAGRFSYRLEDHEQGLSATAQRGGLSVTAGSGEWVWALKLETFGRKGAVSRLAEPKSANLLDGRFSQDWGGGLEEWLDSAGGALEHGFTLAAPPAGDGLLEWAMHIEGDLLPLPGDDRNTLRFADLRGRVALEYANLLAFDANGRELDSWMRVEGNFLRLFVDDADATYPVVVDPILLNPHYLKASDSSAGDEFGSSVDAYGDRVVVGAPVAGATSSEYGAVYIYSRSGDTWVQDAILQASNAGDGDLFGASVSIYDETIVVGAPGEDGTGATTDCGAAYVFEYDSGTNTWNETALLRQPTPTTGSQFGYSVDNYLDRLVVGSPQSHGIGSVFIHTRTGGWPLEQWLHPPGPYCSNAKFGTSVAIHANGIVVGAPGDGEADTWAPGIVSGGSCGAPESGAAYFYLRSSGTWSLVQFMKATNTGLGDAFGHSVSIWKNEIEYWIAVGAPFEDSVSGSPSEGGLFHNTGAVYVYSYVSSLGWLSATMLKASNVPTFAQSSQHDQFGYSVDLDDWRLVVGANGESAHNTGVFPTGLTSDAYADAGAAYLFNLTMLGSTPEFAYIKARNTGAGDSFGTSVAVTADVVVCGAPGEDGASVTIDGNGTTNSKAESGAAYSFDLIANDLAAVPLCPGDGIAVNCPCGNRELSGRAGGCANESGHGAILYAVGSATGSPSTYVLGLERGTANEPAVFYQQTGLWPSPFPFKEGIFCIDSTTATLIESVILDGAGNGQSSVNIPSVGSVPPGTTRFYQAWYRVDVSTAPCSTNSNSSNALQVSW